MVVTNFIISYQLTKPRFCVNIPNFLLTKHFNNIFMQADRQVYVDSIFVTPAHSPFHTCMNPIAIIL